MGESVKITVKEFPSKAIVTAKESVTNVVVNIQETDKIVAIKIIEDYDCPVVEPIKVSNSNDSYLVNTSVDLELPNIDFTNSDGVKTSVPSMEHIIAKQCPSPPSGIAYNRNYSAGQTTSYALYDDGWQEINGKYYDYAILPNSLYTQELDLVTDPTGETLKHLNAFGNKYRYTYENGNICTNHREVSIIDHLSGLMHYIHVNTNFIKGFDDMFGNAGVLKGVNDANFKGYNDWFVANAKICTSFLQSYSYTNGSFTSLLPYYRSVKHNFNTSTAYSPTKSFGFYWGTGLYAYNSRTAARINLLTRIYYK